MDSELEIDYVFEPDYEMHRCSRCDLPFDEQECRECDVVERADGEVGVWKRTIGE